MLRCSDLHGPGQLWSEQIRRSAWEGSRGTFLHASWISAVLHALCIALISSSSVSTSNRNRGPCGAAALRGGLGRHQFCAALDQGSGGARRRPHLIRAGIRTRAVVTPRKRRTRAPFFYRGSEGGARGCGFEEQGVYARTEGGHFL